MGIDSNWPISISIPVCSDLPTRMRKLEENGVHYVELTGGILKEWTIFQNKSRHIFELARENRVVIRSIHLPYAPFDYMDPASSDGSLRALFLKEQSELIRIAADGGVQVVVVHPSGEPYAEQNRMAHLQFSVESIGSLHAVAQSAGVKLAVENLPRSCMCRDCREIEFFKRNLPDIHFCYDSNHSLIDSNVEIIRSMSDRIIALHISDYDFINERHLFPGEGLNPWNEIIETLKEVQYSGTWNYEIRGVNEIPISKFVCNYRMLFQAC